MYAPRHRRFATGLGRHGEVQYFAHDKQNSKYAKFKVQYFMRAGMRN